MAFAQRIKAPRRRPRSESGELARVVPLDRASGTRVRELVEVDAPPIADVAADLLAIARACHAAAAGLDVCARRARSAELAARVADVAGRVHGAADAATALVPGGVRRPSTSERLRWEWLASTAAMLDAAPERRVAEEAVRHLGVAAAAARRASSSSDGDMRALGERVEDAAEDAATLLSFVSATVAPSAAFRDHVSGL